MRDRSATSWRRRTPSEAEIAVADFDGGHAGACAVDRAARTGRPTSQPSLQPEDHRAAGGSPQLHRAEPADEESEKAGAPPLDRAREGELCEQRAVGSAGAGRPSVRAHRVASPDTPEWRAQPRKAGWWSRRFGGGE